MFAFVTKCCIFNNKCISLMKLELRRRSTLKKLISSLSLLTLGAVMSVPAQAAVHYDSHGNVGYDTLAECQNAIQSGTAKFYRSSTTHKPLLRGNEVSVDTGLLGNLAPQYSNGTCDIGTGRRDGRDGVARAIQGKYVPYSPDMLINQYYDRSGNIVRVSMSQCDNWFSGPIPQDMPVVPVPVVTAPAPTPVPQPVVTAPAPTPVPQPVVTAPTPVTPVTAVSAATGSVPVWVPVVIGTAVTAILLSGSDSDSSNTGTTGTTGTN